LSTPGAGDHEQLRSQAPPAASEDIHLPGPTYLPIIVASGITLALVGIIISSLVVLFGMIVWLVATVIWIRAARAEIAELPLDHG
jgi:type IV secretory pathway TrbD component